MATSIALKEDLVIPFIGSLREFRAWALSEDFPDGRRIDYLAGRIEVDMTPEDYYFYGAVKVELVGVLGNSVKSGDLGDLRVDRTRVSNAEADLSVEPDLVFISFETLESDRARLIPKITEEPDRYVEVQGSPDLVVEIVSDRSKTKDNVRLPAAYWRAGVTEYWLIDARSEALIFRIEQHGPSGYEAAATSPEGFQYSAVLKQWFRLARRRDRRGGWAFDLDTRL
ncbi:MAG: Uma2 family endonuclease [Pirellulales bacterium]|nr:Uma2 family endonuclease [Pirellulales bacterium]